ncbi:MAG TPA: 4a-hydroxytetrahydrobiopterin dehydratase [Clostridia bacterium]|nr:4a-hydroxytetrahydrobiopterin dehydratase [Clostridia bacterium]
MSELLEKKCIPCSIGDLPLGEEKIAANLKKISKDWTLSQGRLTKSFAFKDFKEALDFTNKVGALAEKEGHHPVIELGWGKVTIKQWTSKIKGLHENDFILAAKIDKLA